MWKRSKVLFALVLLMLPIGIGRADEGWGTVSREKSNVDLGTLETSVVGEMKVRNAGVSASDGKVVSATMSQDPGSFWNGGVKNGSAAYEGTQKAEAKANVYHLRMQGLVQIGGTGGGGAGGEAPTSYEFTATGRYEIKDVAIQVEAKKAPNAPLAYYGLPESAAVKILCGQNLSVRIVGKGVKGEEINWKVSKGSISTDLGTGLTKDVLCGLASDSDADFTVITASCHGKTYTANVLVCDTVIGIHSTTHSNTKIRLSTLGHAYISVYKTSNELKCYGLYPHHDRLIPWKHERPPISGDLYDTDAIADAIISRYYLINPSRKSVICQRITAEPSYSISEFNCATWAGETYLLSTDEMVLTKEWIDFSIEMDNPKIKSGYYDTPRQCTKSLDKLNNDYCETDQTSNPCSNKTIIY